MKKRVSWISCHLGFTIANKLLFSWQYNGPNWHVHVVSTIHCLVVVTGSFFIFADDTLHQDRVFGYVRWAADIYSISCGYFLWDTIIAIYFYKYQGISMVIHGMVSFSVFIFSFVSDLSLYNFFSPNVLCLYSVLSSTTMVRSSSCTNSALYFLTFIGSW